MILRTGISMIIIILDVYYHTQQYTTNKLGWNAGGARAPAP